MTKSITYNRVTFKMLLACAVLLSCASWNGYCQYELPDEEPGYSILVQASPVDAGFVTPEIGVHRLGINETVVLTAIAKSGYRFVYWLGDVDDPTANETVTNLDSPKIVIAVFEREEFSLLTASTGLQQSSGSSSRRDETTASANRFTPTNTSSSPAMIWPRRPRQELPTQDLFPVPGDLGEVDDSEEEGEDEDEVPPDEPIPEPGTIALLGFGAVAALRRKRRK